MIEKSYKMMIIYINESHKRLLEEFFDKIGFFYYTVQKKIESVWSEKLKHKNSNIWPGTDCLFLLSLPEDEVEKMIINLKTFRVSLPYEIVLSIGVVPMERVIPDLLKEDNVMVDQELLKRLQVKKHKDEE